MYDRAVAAKMTRMMWSGEDSSGIGRIGIELISDLAQVEAVDRLQDWSR
jgi:hypothetical protein